MSRGMHWLSDKMHKRWPWEAFLLNAAFSLILSAAINAAATYFNKV
jgi:hypothetical protein